MRKALQKILNCWGCELTVKNDAGEEAFRGFLQHSGSKSWQNMRPLRSPLGEEPGGQYTLIAPPEAGVHAGDTLVHGDRQYRLCRVETVYYGGEPLYIWGLCTGKGDGDSWGV